MRNPFAAKSRREPAGREKSAPGPTLAERSQTAFDGSRNGVSAGKVTSPQGATRRPEGDISAQTGPGWLTVRDIHKSFKKRAVVRGVNLSLRRGEAVGLLGPNGAGKTTVFYMVTGLIPADKGTILIDGADATHLPMYQRARLGIGYLPQEMSIFRNMTVEQNIMSILQLEERDAAKRRQQLDNLLHEFKIDHLRKAQAVSLSGGERRRCEIARALASRPSYILLDEPFAGIDPIAIGDIRALVRHLKRRGIGVLITDHNVRETLDLIDRAYIIYDGEVLTHGTADAIINNADVRRVYLGDMFVNPNASLFPSGQIPGKNRFRGDDG